jgi:macrolide-specific efflux system membrane fusion protein
MSFAIRRLSAMTARRRKAFYGLAALLAILLMGGAGRVQRVFREC